MAYVAVISLQQTINDVVSCSRTPPLPSTPEILESTSSLLQLLERRKRSSRRLDDLEGQIRDFAHKLEDALELHDSDELEEEIPITSFRDFARNMEKDYVRELSSPQTEEEDDDDDDDGDGNAAPTVSPNTDSGEEMVGHTGLFNTVKDRLLKKMRPDETCFFSVFGEKGSQRTTAAKAVFEDLRRKQLFDCCAWVAVDAKHRDRVKDILIRVISQVDNLAAADLEELMSMEKGKLCNYLHGILESRRYMIALDDVSMLVLLYMRRSLPDEANGSLVILTTNEGTVAQLSDDSIGVNGQPYYFERFTWYAMRLIMFGSRLISPELEEAAKKIIQNCRCRYVSAAKTFLFLLNLKTVEQWMEIAADEKNPIFVVVDEISEINKIKEEIRSCDWELDDKLKEAIVCVISMFLNISSSIETIKQRIQPERFFPKMQIISLFGMSGIGKSALAVKIFKDESILGYFEHCVWVTLGQEYQTEILLIDIMAQIYPNIDKLHMQRDEKLVKGLCERVSRKRCLIVLDDLCSNEPLHHLRNLFPDFKGTTLVTTTLAKVAKFERDDLDCEMKLLDEEESWRLLCRKVFGGEGLCPPQLEKVGRKIAEKCDGLPLLILIVAEELLKVEMSEDHWNNVVSSRQSSVFMNAHRKISKELLPMYSSLPSHLKACFLYMGVFREKYEISTSELIDLWVAEGFLIPRSPQTVEDYVTECLLELVDRSLVMVQRNVSGFGFKTCRLHVVYWHLSNGVALRDKFFHAMNSYDDCSEESIMDQRIICVRNSILLGMGDVQNTMASNTSAHSLLCVSSFQQYPVPVDFDLSLLRVMRAHTIRLYEFPTGVVRRVRLRYLSLTSNGKVPTSISDLRKLQHLTLKRYTKINSSQSSWDLPVEIWDMKELKHLQIMGGCLPSRNGGEGLAKLAALLDVSVQCCREDVFDRIPNLKRLSIRIELEPDDEGTSFYYLNNICRLDGLESLKCVVVNPIIKSKVVRSFVPVSMFPPNLKKLSLSGLGLSWEDMNFIEKCKDLEVLKLKHYAFRGPKWEIGYRFCMIGLKFVLLEDSDLVEWKVNFGPMECLCIKHCYKLREFPIGHFKTIEIVDSSPLCMTWATKEGQLVSHCRTNVCASWIARTKGGEVTPTRFGPAGWTGVGPFFH